MKDLCVIQESNPTLLIEIGGALGCEGVNIEGLSLSSLNSQSIVHFLVNDEVSALDALYKAGIEVTAVSDVFVFAKDEKQVTGKAGSFGELCKTLNENGVQINFGYPAENNRFVFGVSDIVKTKALLG
ncbi:MAG: hypothetical protein GY834_08800 [Bacteroidetes bacterium]|nr:hypothetical protein [Bacteroidota bacterium]